MKRSFKHLVSSFVLATSLVFAAMAATPALASEAGSAPEIEQFASTTTRAQVRAELEHAMAQRQLPRTEADVQRLAEARFQPVKTRAQVGAETREALRLGLVPHNDADFERVATVEQLRLVALAGLRADDTQLARR